VNVGWLLRSSTLWGALLLSAITSLAVLLLSPYGLGSLRKRESEIAAFRQDLQLKTRKNRELLEEVKRLAAKDPELLEALARKQGYQRPGEKVYTFRERSESR
jgi:cell division protein FtsB